MDNPLNDDFEASRGCVEVTAGRFSRPYVLDPGKEKTKTNFAKPAQIGQPSQISIPYTKMDTMLTEFSTERLRWRGFPIGLLRVLVRVWWRGFVENFGRVTIMGNRSGRFSTDVSRPVYYLPLATSTSSCCRPFALWSCFCK